MINTHFLVAGVYFFYLDFIALLCYDSYIYFTHYVMEIVSIIVIIGVLVYYMQVVEERIITEIKRNKK